MTDTPTTRILDAAVNRTNEGLRVVEDFVRFVLDDAHLTAILKQLRHDLREACSALPSALRHAARDTQHDIGTQISTAEETRRAGAWDVCQASCERVKQSLRSLEEYSKVAAPALAARLESLRYRFYTIEGTLTLSQDGRLRLRGVNLCVLIDGFNSTEEFAHLAQQLVAADVPMIQLRDKRLSDAELVERARVLVKIARSADLPSPSPSPPRQTSGLTGRGTTLAIVNDRADVAATVDADGVHLGQDDLSVKDARSIVGPRKLIGVSTHNIEQARIAVLDGANYLGAGPTFPSSTKEFKGFPGLKFLQQLADEIGLPSFAIGGIEPENLPQVLAAGFERVAVSGAVTQAEKPVDAVRAILNILRHGTAC